MKKLTAVLSVLLLLISVLSFGVSAEGFVFKELSRTQSATQLEVTWNMHEFTQGDEIEDILIGGQSVPFAMAGELLVIDLSGIEPGNHSVVYEYVSGDKQGSVQGEALRIGGEVAVTLSAVVNGDGTVTITAKTPHGKAVPQYNLRLTIGNMAGLSGKTDANGRYTSYITLEDGQSAFFEGVAHSDGSVTYLAAAQQSVSFVKPTTVPTTVPTTTVTTEDTGETTTTVEGETTTTVEGETTTEAETETTVTESTTTTRPQTIVTVVGAGTTSLKGDQVMLNVSTDTGILNLFELTSDRFADRARLYLSQADYAGLVGRNSSNMLMLNMLTAKEQASESQVSKALENASQFEKYGDNERSWVTFDLSFLLLDKGGNVRPLSAMPIDSTYVIELPVPESMKDCDEFAITVKDGEGWMTPAMVQVSGGTFKLEINALDSYTLLGFVSQNGDKAGGVSIWVVLLYVLGVLLLAGAAALLFFVVLRKPAKKNEEAPEIVVEAPAEDGNDIYSGRTDLPPSDSDN